MQITSSFITKSVILNFLFSFNFYFVIFFYFFLKIIRWKIPGLTTKYYPVYYRIDNWKESELIDLDWLKGVLKNIYIYIFFFGFHHFIFVCFV